MGDVSDDKKESSKIVVDKLAFDEDMIRKLKELVRNHKTWSTKISRMCATLGDSMIMNHDVIDESFLYEDKELEKQENETERTLEFLLNDFNSLLDPILGQNSKIATALSCGEEDSKLKADNIILFLDTELSILPWEGLFVLKNMKGRLVEISRYIFMLTVQIRCLD